MISSGLSASLLHAAIDGYLSVFRVFISKQDSTFYAKAINRMLDTVTKSFPGFERGRNIDQIMVDFSDAEDNGSVWS